MSAEASWEEAVRSGLRATASENRVAARDEVAELPSEPGLTACTDGASRARPTRRARELGELLKQIGQRDIAALDAPHDAAHETLRRALLRLSDAARREVLGLRSAAQQKRAAAPPAS